MRLSFDMPSALNGETLADELAAIGVTIAPFGIADEPEDGKRVLVITTTADHSDAEMAAISDVVAAHDGAPTERTPAEKLAAVGLTVDELKSLVTE
jgi:hypothetical protein